MACYRIATVLFALPYSKKTFRPAADHSPDGRYLLAHVEDPDGEAEGAPSTV